MFSRKKNDLLIAPMYEEGRAFFRIEPSEKSPIDVFIKSHTYRIKFIGDGGIGVYRRGNEELKVGEEYSFEMTLPLIDETISGTIRIVDISDRAYYGVFVGLSPQETEKIHHFVLEIQKREKRSFTRVEPSNKRPINVSIGSKTYKMKDIGAGGISVYRDGDKALETGRQYPFEMALPLIDEAISGTIRVVDISEKTCQCVFVDLSREDTDKIQLFVFETQNRETAAFFRVQLPSKDPVDVSIGIHTYQIEDIGAGGICLRRNGDTELELGKEYLFKFTLPLIDEMISGIIRIVNVSDTTYHSVFVEISDEEKEYIHLFVLEMQKDKLRKKRRK